MESKLVLISINPTHFLEFLLQDQLRKPNEQQTAQNLHAIAVMLEL